MTTILQEQIRLDEPAPPEPPLAPEAENTSSTDAAVGELIDLARALIAQALIKTADQHSLAEGYRATSSEMVEWSETAITAQTEMLPPE